MQLGVLHEQSVLIPFLLERCLDMIVILSMEKIISKRIIVDKL